MVSLRCPRGKSASGSVYFFWRCTSKSSFGILRTLFPTHREQFLGECKRDFSKLRLAFRFSCHCFFAFSALAMTSILSFTSDYLFFCFFSDPQSSGISQIRFIRSFCSTLKRPLSLSLSLSLSLLFGVRMVFPFWTSAVPKWSRDMYNFSERMQFHSERSLQAVSENKRQLFIEGLPSIVICLRPINVNCILFHTRCGWLTNKVTLSTVVIFLTLVPFHSLIYLWLRFTLLLTSVSHFCVVDSHSLDACKTASATALYVCRQSKFVTWISQCDDLILHCLLGHHGGISLHFVT